MNARQQRFADLVLTGHPASRAYIAAGYSVRSPRSAEANSSRLMRNAEVATYIAEQRALAAALSGISLSSIITDLQAHSRMRFAAVRGLTKILAGASLVSSPLNLEVPSQGSPEQRFATFGTDLLKAAMAGEVSAKDAVDVADVALRVRKLGGFGTR